MLKNYLVTTLRALHRRPGTTALHVGGLAAGLACCFLAGLYVQDELRYDRFHEDADRIFALSNARQFGDRVLMLLATRPEGVKAVRAEVPGVVAATVMAEDSGIARRPGQEGFETEAALFTDAAFFDVFTFPLARGDARAALRAPNQAVLTASLARTLFGDEDPVGQVVELERSGFGVRDPAPLTLTVTGVAEDPPGASSIQFDLLISGATPVTGHGELVPRLATGGQTYVRTRAAADTVAIKATLDRIVEADTEHAFGTFAGTRTTPLVEQHLGAHSGGMAGQWFYLRLFSVVAGLILLLACINYANMATAIALGRATEVGVRKAVGAARGQLTVQFLTEALVLAALAGVVALALVTLVLPSFNAFFDKGIELRAAGPGMALAAVGIVVATGGLAGLYPAFVLARFRPAAVLKGGRVQGRGGTRVRQALVVVQFAVTAVLLTGTAVVTTQLRYAQQRDLGFWGDQVVTLPLKTNALIEQRAAFRQEMAALPGVRRASLASGGPGELNMIMQVTPPASEGGEPGAPVRTWFANADEAYAQTLGLELAAGRWFRDGEPASNMVLNEASARELGLMTDDPAEVVGRTIGGLRGDVGEGTVVGVVRDFHFAGLRRSIEPLAFLPLDDGASRFFLNLQLDRADLPGALAAVRATWERIAPGYPFDATFVDEQFADELREDRQLSQLFGAFGGLAILLALFGLFGLATHAAERRRKEVGVRKVLGASVGGLVLLLTRDFVGLVVLALGVATPVAVLLARRWLEDFAYPTPLGAGPFAWVAVGLIGLTLLAVGAQAFRAATADPVDSLRTE